MKGQIIYILKNDQIEAILKHCTSYTKMAVVVNEHFPHKPEIFIEYIEDGKVKTVKA